MSNIIGEAFVRVHSLTDTFRSETQRGVKTGLAGALSGLGAGGAAGLLRGAGIAGLGTAIALELKKESGAAAESERIQTQLAQAVRNTGRDYDTLASKIDDAIQAQSELGAFDDEALAATFTTLERRTGDWTKAIELNALAMDVSRGRNIQLEAAANLVLRAANGQGGALRRLGIDTRGAANATQLLGILQDKYAGSAERFGETSAGSFAKLNKQLSDTRELLGAIVNDVAGPAADELAGVLKISNEVLATVTANTPDQAKSFLKFIATDAALAIVPTAQLLHNLKGIKSLVFGGGGKVQTPDIPFLDREDRNAGATSAAAAAAQNAADAAARRAKAFGDKQKTELRLREAQRKDDLAGQLREANHLLEIARRRVAIVKTVGPLLAQRKQEEADALDTVDNIRDAIRAKQEASQAQAKADAEAAAANRKAELAQARSDAEAELVNNRERARLTDKTLKDDRDSLRKLIAFYRAQEKNRTLERSERLSAERSRIAAQAELRGLGTTGGIAGSIADREAALGRRDEIADRTTRLTDDIKVARDRLKLYVVELRKAVKDTDATKEERQKLRAALEKARTDLSDLLRDQRKEAFEGTEAQLANDVRAAKLTKPLTDDIAAVRRQIAFYGRELRRAQKDADSTKKDRQALRAKLIDAQEALQGLTKTGGTAQQGTTAFELLQQTAQSFSQFGGNLIGRDQPFAGPTGFTADLAQFLRRTSGGSAFPSSRTAGAKPVLELDDVAIVTAMKALTDALTGRRARGAKDGGAATASGAIGPEGERWREAARTRKAVDARSGV